MVLVSIMDRNTEYETIKFASPLVWERWLSKHHKTIKGVWVQIAKKASGIKTVTYDEALDVALCYGWIDGLKRTFDANYFVQKFTPRRPKGLWSKRNVAKVVELIKTGKMKPAGLAEVKTAKRDGRFNAAYDSQKNMLVPKDFLVALKKHKKADAFFKTLNKTNVYAIAWRLQTAKTPETRARRFSVLLEMLKQGKKPH